jgi:23S rRNA (pseudouridine1915-N3)-methyltransferase
MSLEIIRIGKIKNKEIKKLCQYYEKLVSKYSKLSLTILNETNAKNIAELRKTEGEKLSKSIDRNCFNIILDENGKEFGSEEFANFLNEKLIYGKKIKFFIPGPFGIEEIYKNKFDFKLSLSKMTFTHEIAYLILMEQLFRSMKILNNEKYNY